MRFLEMLKKNEALEINGDIYDIALLSNITISNSKEVFEYRLKKAGVNPKVIIGDYDNIIQDAEKYKRSKAIVVFWECINIIEGLEWRYPSMSEEKLLSLVRKTEDELLFLFKTLKKSSLVFINSFSSVAFYKPIHNKGLSFVADKLNLFLKEHKPKNFLIVDLNIIFPKVGIEYSFEIKKYHDSKILYSFDFYCEYLNAITPLIKAAIGKNKKALILDCDNTLWNGIIGEDGQSGIDMNKKNLKGRFFYQAQNLILGLQKQGVIIGLCSKNNMADVEKVMNSHPDMLIKRHHLSILKVNWNDKASNLNQIAKELNIGIDSIVMIDDSDFEINLINEKLPQVKTYQVPKKLYTYPSLFNDIYADFITLSNTKEDQNKTILYQDQLNRKNSKSSYENIDNYLESLGLELLIEKNNFDIVPRIAQLTQKTNQFNLTTKRYTETDIENFMSSSGFDVFSFNLKDKFGVYGITGVAITKLINNEMAEIDTFLMSCRVIGRKVELAFLDFIIEYLKSVSVLKITSRYIISEKNNQVKDFYERTGFKLTEKNIAGKSLQLDLNNYKSKKVPFIKINI
jgi:FkbH-like protein